MRWLNSGSLPGPKNRPAHKAWIQVGMVACLLAATHEAAVAQKRGATVPEDKVGLVTRAFTPTARRNWRGATDHALHVTVWYPAAEGASEVTQWIGPLEQPLFDAGRAAPHAAFAPAIEPVPLILLSHGTGGSAAQLGWLATALARAGFLVAAVDHPGNSSVGPLTPEGFALWWERASDLTEVLDGLLADSEIGPHIDKDRIGVAGFSLGGYTALELAGARTDIAAFYDLCRKEPGNAACHVPEMKDAGTPANTLEAVRKSSGESLARASESYRDPRIRAVFAMAPSLGFTLTPESLRSIHLPVELVVGSADVLAPATDNADLIKARLRGTREVVLPNVTHYTFLDTCTAAGKASEATICTDQAGIEREAIHAQTADLAVQFFLKSLRGR